ncbi:MAG: glycosyltransferase family 2 protein [Planctomycetota bacterium]|nr:glycosyltransferase family 2 protein [Planctomycetota bacterium]
MLAIEVAGLVVLGAVLGVWLSRAVTVYSAKGRGPVLSRDSHFNVADQGLVSVIVPAKDEEANIGAALETILAQDYPNIEIIVVDDRSTDGTAEVVRQVAARDGRVRLVQVKELAAGWFGKPHAMHTGAREARGEWLLFVDADCRQAPHSVRVGVEFCAAEGGEMLSLWPVLEMRSFWENAVQPVAGSVLVAWFRPGWVNDPKHRAAFANGQYILIRRSTYEAVGGYGAVRAKVVEDIAFAREVKGRGHRLLNAVGQDLFTTRMYDSLRAMWKGWTRIFYGAFGGVGQIVGVFFLTFFFTLLPFAVLAASAFALWASADKSAAVAASAFAEATADQWGAGGWWIWTVLAASLATVVAIFVTMRRLFIAGCGNPWYLALYPVAVVMVMAFEAGALARALGVGAVTWRGTTYKGGRVVSGKGTS